MTPPVLNWRKSSYSNDTGGECVQFAPIPERGAAVRDTQNRGLGHLTFPSGEWTAFLREVASGRS